MTDTLQINITFNAENHEKFKYFLTIQILIY